MKEIFTTPVCELIILENKDILTASKNLDIDLNDVGDILDLPEIGD